MEKAEKIAAAISDESFTIAQQRFVVEYDYPVYFTRALFRPANSAFVHAITRLEPEKRHRLVAFLDDGLVADWPGLNTAIATYVDAHRRQLELLAEPQRIAGGERVKNTPALISDLQHRLLDLAIDRHSYVVAIGGGAVLDAVGYVAATLHRGVRHIRVPTTVLAQNDSGVGVKNAINAFGVKNLVGTFAPPFAVLNDFDFLATLEPRDKIAGMAEAVKVALIRNPRFFDWLEANADALSRFETDAAHNLIRRCAELHLRHIATSGDPFEMGSARPLDFGHWAAHKLESLSQHALRHGEAVAIGIALDARYSVQQGLLEKGDEVRVYKLLARLGFRLWHPAMEQRARDDSLALLAGLQEFREHLGGELTVTMLVEIGRGVEVHEIDEACVIEAIAWLKERDSRR
ncbi:MAG: 3-dehydroquinate synthase [Acidiferrobacterales bacterium]